MTTQEGNNAVVARHLEALATAAKNYTLAELANVSAGGASYADATTVSSGLMSATDKAKLDNLTNYTLPTASTTTKGGVKIGSGLQMDGDTLSVTLQSGSSGGTVLYTVPSTVDGGIWFEVTNNIPALWIHKGNYDFRYSPDKARFVGNTDDALAAYLPFDVSATADVCGNEWTATGDVSLSQEIKKFGTSSLYLQNGNIRTPVFFELNSESWTFDEWIFLDANKKGEFFTCWTSTDWRVLAVDVSGSSWILNSNYSYGSSFSLTFPSGVWFHFAVVKDGNNVHFFVDGVKQKTATLSTAIPPTDSTQVFLIIGNNGGNFHVDNVRFFDGVALWTTDFTPPTAEDYL